MVAAWGLVDERPDKCDDGAGRVAMASGRPFLGRRLARGQCTRGTRRGPWTC